MVPRMFELCNRLCLLLTIHCVTNNCHARTRGFYCYLYHVISLFFHLILIFCLHCQSFLRISVFTKICNKKITFQCIIFIVPEEGWFGQPKYSTHIKTFLRCTGFCLYFLNLDCREHNGVCDFSCGCVFGFHTPNLSLNGVSRAQWLY